MLRVAPLLEPPPEASGSDAATVCSIGMPQEPKEEGAQAPEEKMTLADWQPVVCEEQVPDAPKRHSVK